MKVEAPGPGVLRVPPHYMSGEDEQVLEEAVRETDCETGQEFKMGASFLHPARKEKRSGLQTFEPMFEGD